MKCSIRNLTINYEIIGEGKPIVIIHGYTVDHRLMLGCMEPIFNNKNNYKRIYIDLPGMGESECADWVTSSDVILDIVIEFINKMIPNDNFLLAGQSYGGYIARGIIYKMMDRVDGMLLICPLIITDIKEINAPKHVVLLKDERLLSKLNPKDAENFNSIAVIQNEKIYDRYKKEIVSGIEIANKPFLQNLDEKGCGFSFDVDKLDKKFDKPSLIITGRQDSRVGYKDALNILGNFPRASFSIIDMAGHNLQIEQEDVFNVLVNEWLERVSHK